jgi:hypothetical protein
MMPGPIQNQVFLVFSKGKAHSRTGHEDPEGDQKYSRTLSLTSALDGSGLSTPRPGCFTAERPDTHRTGGWAGHMAGLNG